MRPLSTCAREVLAWLLKPSLLLGFLLLHLPVWALALGEGSSSPEAAWLGQSRILALGFWLPGIWVAFWIRQAWPALGAGDEGLDWLRSLAVSRVATNLGVLLGGLLALILLGLLNGGLLGLVLGSQEGRPEFRESLALPWLPPGRRDPREAWLLRPGDHQDFHLPAFPGEGRLQLRPRFLVGGAEAIELGLALDPAGELGKVRLPGPGLRGEVVLPRKAGQGGRLRITRLDSPGAPLSLSGGRVLLRTRSLDPLRAILGLTLHLLPWGLLLLSLALALSTVLDPHLGRLGLLGLVPATFHLPVVSRLDPGEALASGSFVPFPSPSWPFPVLLALALGLGFLAPRRGGEA